MDNSKCMSPRPMAGLAVGCLLFLGAAEASAQEKHKFQFAGGTGATTRYTQQHTIAIGDVPGHEIRIGELLTKYGNEAPEYAGVKVVEISAKLSSDYINGSGRFTSYNVQTMANGDKIFTRAEGLTHTTAEADGARKATFSTVTTITGGTGKFATLRGLLRGTGATDFKTGTRNNVTEGEYWFEK